MLRSPLLQIVFLMLACGLTIGCASTGGSPGAAAGDGGAAVQRLGTAVTGLEFLYGFENEASALYYPLEGLAGCQYADDGTLIICDEQRGKVYGLDPATRRWFEFDSPLHRPYNPVDVRVDGFRILVLDLGASSIQRFDLSGAWKDELLDVQQVDPSGVIQPSAFAVDRDGRLVVADGGQDQVLLLDSFLDLHSRIGEQGTLDDQFHDPSGIVFLPGGGFVVSDRGNRRLSVFGRMGFPEGVVGGDFEIDNPFVAPQGIDADRYGNLFVADPGSGLIHVLDNRQRFSFSAGRDYDLRGTPLAPVDVAVGPDGELAVTDRARSAILVYRIIYE